MDQLSKYFENGMVEGTLYKRQLKSCISDVFKARIQLENHGFNIEKFIERENLEEKYPEGLRRLNLADGLDSDQTINMQITDKLLGKTADYVANSIELLDLVKLRTIAKVEYIVPLLDEMIAILPNFPKIGTDHWIAVEIEGWRTKLLDLMPSATLSEENCEKLEFDAARWLGEFRRTLKEM